MSVRTEPRAGLMGEPPTAPPVRGRRVERLRQRRRRRWSLVVGVVVVVGLVIGGSIVLFAPGAPAPVRTAPPVGGSGPSSLVWAVQWVDPGAPGGSASVAMIADPVGKGPVAVVVPDNTFVDLPSGAPTNVAQASVTGPAAMEAAQTAFDRRIGYYLSSTLQQLSDLVDRLDGVHVVAEVTFINGGAQLGPGPLTMSGSMVVAYLTTAKGVDRWVRWEDVLTGILAAPQKASAWSVPAGQSDDWSAVSSLLEQANGAPVIELPTAPSAQGGVEPDRKAIASSISGKLGSALGTLVQVIVQNGNGRPGLGAIIGEMLAPYGFRVVTSQNASSFDVEQTQIIAANPSFVPWADKAMGVLGAGKVYQGSQPTGIADVTIVVGKDFTAG